MRFIKFLAAAVLVVLLSSSSCSHEQADMPQGGPVSIMATASGYKWMVGDAVFATLSGGGSTQLRVTSVKPTGTAVLEGNLPEGKTLDGFAVFPYGNYRRHANSVAVTLPAAYEGLAADRALLAASVSPGSSQIAFAPVGGKVSVTFENIPSIAAGAVFISDGAASGSFTLSEGKSSRLELSPGTETGREIHLRFDGPKDEATVTVPLPPGTYSHWRLGLEDAEGHLLRFATPLTASDLNVSPGSVLTREKVTFPKFHYATTEKVYGLAADAVLYMYPDDTETTLSEGVTETDIHFTKGDGSEMHAYIIQADLSRSANHLRIGAPYADNSTFGKQRQTLSAQAPLYETESTRPVVIVNADFWSTSGTWKNQLRGPIHTGGTVLKDTFLYEDRLSQQALSYAGLRKDGTLTIQPRDRYASEKNSLEECSGGGVIMLYDGEIPDLDTYPGIDPRTVIGYRDRTVCFLVVDGRQKLWSNGLGYAELGSIMKAIGCTSAVNLDGGGSTQLLVRNPRSGAYEIRNHPCDNAKENGTGGTERAVAETWIIFTDYAR